MYPGFFLCLFSASIYVSITLRRTQDNHSKVHPLHLIVNHSHSKLPDDVHHRNFHVHPIDHAFGYVRPPRSVDARPSNRADNARPIVGMNCFRMIEGYVVHVNDPGGAVAYIGNLAPWDHVFKDTLYATQEIFGDAVAVCCFLRRLCGDCTIG